MDVPQDKHRLWSYLRYFFLTRCHSLVQENRKDVVFCRSDNISDLFLSRLLISGSSINLYLSMLCLNIQGRFISLESVWFVVLVPEYVTTKSSVSI